MTFAEYLRSKKIDSDQFKIGNPDQWNEFNIIFQQMHPNSFTAQKLYLINGIRRKYALSQVDETTKTEEVSVNKPIKPMMKPKRPVAKPAKPIMKRPKTR